MSCPEPTMSVAAAVAATRFAMAEDSVAVLTMSALAYWQEPRTQDFRLVGTMGAAASIGLGIAIGAPERQVVVVDGDGSLLMQLAVLPAVGTARTANFAHVVIDNGVYAISGAQPTPSPANWVGLFLAAGYVSAHACDTPDDLRDALLDGSPGPRALVARCLRERPNYPKGAFAIVPEDEARRVRASLNKQVVSSDR